MKVSVFGLGYVGCVSAACLARDGHDVTGVDVNPDKVDACGQGRSPVTETGLDDLMRRSAAGGRLRATTNAGEAVRQTDVSLVCVGTPGTPAGKIDLRQVDRVVRQIGLGIRAKDGYHTVVVRSTVLPGTIRRHLLPILRGASGREPGSGFGLCMNPEFLREGTAVDDFDHPELVVLGQFDPRSGDAAAPLYRGIDAPLVRTGIETAEMLKYACNTFHAVKIAFANEIGVLCKAHGIDGRELMEHFCRDRKLNVSHAYLMPGFAFGGSCLPKDTRALIHRAREKDLDVPLLRAAMESNARQLERGIDMVERAGRNRVGVLGLSFKAGTDDVRESPVVPLVETLHGRGYSVAVYDEYVAPEALMGTNRAFLHTAIPHIASMMRKSLEAVLAESEVIVVTRKAPAFADVPARLRGDQVLVDLAGIAPRNGQREKACEGICW